MVAGDGSLSSKQAAQGLLTRGPMTQLPEHPDHRYTRGDVVTATILIVVVAMLLGVSPGLALIASAALMLVLTTFTESR